MAKVSAFSNLDAAGAADAALINVPSGAVGVALGTPPVLAAALVAYPTWIWLAEGMVKVAAIKVAIHRTRGVAFACAHRLMSFQNSSR
jgi:hypothetical protein